MNNKKVTTLYLVSRQGEQNGFLRHLVDQVHHGYDPLLAWADFLDVQDDTMSELLCCPLHTYQLHKDMAQDAAGSPLTTKHVLNFCEKSEIHPADLAPTTEYPEDACRPYIFAALLEVKSHGKYKADQVRAEKAMNLERTRYDVFLETYQFVGELFAEMQSFAYAKDPVNAAVTDPIYPELRACFMDKAVDLQLPQFHAEDYHLHLIPKMKEKQAGIDALKKEERQRRIDLRQSAEFLFGRPNKEPVWSAIEDLCDLLDNETGSEYGRVRRIRMLNERLSARFPVNQKKVNALRKYQSYIGPVSPAVCVEKFAEAAISYRNFQRGEYKEQLALLEQALGRDDEYLMWLKAIEQPGFFYMQYLYANNAIDHDRPKVSVSVAGEISSRYDHN